MSSAPRPRLAESLHGIVDAGLQTVQTRLELLAIELQAKAFLPLQRYERGRMIAGAFFATDNSIDASRSQSREEIRAQEQMVEP